jgi:hypothetical protein
MITSLDNDFIESIIEKYGNKLLKINLSNNGKSVSFEIKTEWNYLVCRSMRCGIVFFCSQAVTGHTEQKNILTAPNTVTTMLFLLLRLM